MPNAAPDGLATFIDAAFRAVGASAAEAATIARHMVGANLAGHYSNTTSDRRKSMVKRWPRMKSRPSSPSTEALAGSV